MMDNDESMLKVTLEERIKVRIRQAMERYEKERLIIRRKRVPTFGRMKRNGIKMRLKQECLKVVRDEYSNI
ncbi:MAG TPA: hypothetical protein PK114_06980 [Smithellaceae bacterium]|nr:hypothetical protein [Smithellaceae bacterium]